MENNWKNSKLGDLVEILSSRRVFYSDYVENGIPFYRSKEVIDFAQGNFYQPELFISKDKFEELIAKNGYPLDGDILISAVGERAGIPYVVKNLGEFYFKDGNVIWIKSSDNLSNVFLSYWLKSFVGIETLNSLFIGSAQKALTIIGLKNIEIQLPPLPVQKAIASVLSSLDEKIDLLNQQNQTLEALAETLFRQWFINYSENQHEPKKETEIGNVPESFKVVQIKDLAFVLETGKRPKGGVGTLTSGIPSIGAENIKGLGKYDHSKTKYLTQEFADKMNRGHIKGYELLIYKDGGTPGHFIPRYSIFGNGFPFDTMTINEHVFKLDFNDKAFNFFCYFYFQTDLVDSILVANGAKAAIPGINQDDVKNLWIIHPETPIIKKFGDLTLPYLEKILFNCNQIQTLTQLRDTLLPKLMSGEVRVKM